MLTSTSLGELLFVAKNALTDDRAWFDAMSDKAFQDWIVDLIREDQLIDKNIDGDGKPIGYMAKDGFRTTYSPATEAITNGRKRAGDPFNLYDTGAFHKSIFITVMRDSFIVDGNGNKGDDDLFVKFGDEIIGITDENMDRVSAILADKYREYLIKVLFDN